MPHPPYRMRRTALVLVALLAALAVAIPAGARTAPVHGTRALTMATLEAGVLTDLNAIRTQHGLVPLRISTALDAAAVEHTREMAAEGYFEHDSADGTAFWKRIQRFYPSASSAYWSVGENLLWSAPDVDPQKALDLWMASPEHKRNILDPTWREIGVAALHVDAAPGTYGNQPVTIVTTDFGVRR